MQIAESLQHAQCIRDLAGHVIDEAGFVQFLYLSTEAAEIIQVNHDAED